VVPVFSFPVLMLQIRISFVTMLTSIWERSFHGSRYQDCGLLKDACDLVVTEISEALMEVKSSSRTLEIVH
jgi:hypothetical protein